MKKTAKSIGNSVLEELKGLIGAGFWARNTVYGSRNLPLYMDGDIVTLTGVDGKRGRITMRNEDTPWSDMDFIIDIGLFQRDFDMAPARPAGAARTSAPDRKGPAHTPVPEQHKEKAALKPDRKKPMTVSQEVFKQLIFDTVMESQDQMSEDAMNALLDILNRYEIGSPWRSMEDGKPASGRYFFIRMKKSAGYTDPYWEQPLLAIRTKGGFHAAGSPFRDEEVEAYSEIAIPD